MSVMSPTPTHRMAPDEERRLFMLWHDSGDREARDALLERFMPLARRLARRYGRSSEPLEDLTQVASLGLLMAIDRFDPERGHRFAAFAVPTILGEMRRHFRDCGWSLHVPRGTQELVLKVRNAQEELASRGRAPNVGKLAEYLEIDREQVVDALQAADSYRTLSLDAPRPAEETEESITYGDAIGCEDERYELVELDCTLTPVLDSIPARERLILRLRFVEEMTQTEIAQRVGVSQMQVSRLLRRSLEQLRALTQDASDTPVQAPKR